MKNGNLWLVFLVLFVLQVPISQGGILEKLQGDRFVFDLRYHSTHNFLKKNIYKPFGLKKCYLRSEVTGALKKLESTLRKEKLKMLVWDCFRPLAVQAEMWKLVPDPRYVADPKVGSNHNRGAAIDLALADESGRALEFPTFFDDFSNKAHHDYQCSPAEKTACDHRKKLKELMESVGLAAFPTEWWHYQLPESEKLPLIPEIESTKSD